MARHHKPPPQGLARVQVPVRSQPRVEGHGLTLTPLASASRFGANGVSFGLDISTAPVPHRRYASEVCGCRAHLGDAILIFGQFGLDGESLDSALVVRMNPVAVFQFLRSVDTMNEPNVETIGELMGISAAQLDPMNRNALEMATVVANLVAIAVAGFETCMDFYHASAFAVRNAAESKTLDVEPIVRVDLQTGMFIALVSRLREVASTLPRGPLLEGL